MIQLFEKSLDVYTFVNYKIMKYKVYPNWKYSHKL